MTDDYIALVHALYQGDEEEDQLIRLAIADWHEERGEIDRANNWRNNHALVVDRHRKWERKK